MGVGVGVHAAFIARSLDSLKGTAVLFINSVHEF